MRSRLNISIIFVLSCFALVCPAAQPPDPNRSTKYLDAVREFADNVLKYGRDTYGPKHTPLFVDGLNIHTYEPVKWIDPDGTKWILSNLASQQTLMRTLDGLSTITGDPKYKQAAMDAIEYAFANLRSPNGLLYWGASRAYDAQSDKMGGSGQHVLKANYPYYELMWQVNPGATKQFIEAFWSAHIMDWSNLEMNRIGPLDRLRVARGWEHEYKGGPVFFQSTGRSFDSTAADLNYAACILFECTRQKKPLIWAKRLAHRYVETRDPTTGIGSYVFTLPKNATKHPLADDFAGHTVHMGSFFFTLGLGNPKIHQHILGGLTYSPGILGDPAFSSRICELLFGEVLGEDGTEFVRWAREELTAWGKVAYRKEDNTWIPMLSDGTSLEGYVCRTDIDGFGLKGDMLGAWKAGLTDLWAYALAYRMTGDEFMWEMARSIALGNELGDIGKHSEELQPNIETTSSNVHALLGFLALYKRTGKTEFLKMAQSIGDNILANRFHNKFFLPSEKHVYAKLDALESVVLLHLHAMLRPDCPSPPMVWPSRPRFQQPYRGIGIACDRALIYTVTESGEPPISLNEAAAMGNTESIESLIAKGIDINNREHDFKTPLHRATISGHKDVVALLIAQGAQIDAKDSFPGGTALHYAVEKDHREIAEFLIAKGANVNAKRGYPAGDTPLHSAVRRGDQDIVELLIAKGADVNAQNDSGQTPLDVATRGRHREITELLRAKVAKSSIHGTARLGALDNVKDFVENGIDVNEKDAYGMTPLHLVAQGGHREIVEFLLSKNADVNPKNNDGTTPLDVARSERHNDVVKLLVEAGADIPTIHLAASVGSLDTLRSFMETGADINAKGKNGRTPLLRAVTGGHVDAVRILIDNGADVNTGDEQGYVPLMHALWTMNSDMVKLLLERGADTNIKDTPSGYAPLHWAVLMGSKELTELVMEAGGDVNAKSKTGETPLDLAKQGGPEIVELLRKHILPHYVAITSLSVPSTCVQGDILPVTVSVGNEGDQREAFRITLLDTTGNVEIAGREMTVEPQKYKSANGADLILSPPSSSQGNFGWGINIDGDVNHDGYADLLIGGGISDNARGRVCLYFGGTDMRANPDMIFEGESKDDYFNRPALGDVNGDGYDDVIIGARGYNNNDGRVYIFFGGIDIDEEVDVILDGEAGKAGTFSCNCLSAGDVDKDGYADVLVGSFQYGKMRGRAFLYFGGDPMDSIVDLVFEGERAGDCFGRNARIGQDLDGDGFRDILIGARSAPDGKNSGRAYLFYGNSQSKMDAVCDMTFKPPISGWQEFGSSLDIFDIDNDRHADVVIGAREYRQSQGGFFLYWGHKRSEMDAVADVISAGDEGAQSSLGGDRLFCGDFNKDGYGDVAIGAYNWYQKNRTGRTYIFYGDAKSLIDSQPDVILTGDQESGYFGHDIGGGDFNNDGCDDLVAGAWGYNEGEGKAYLFYGPFHDTTDITFNWDTTNASIGKHILRASIAPVEGKEDVADKTTTVEVEVKERSQ